MRAGIWTALAIAMVLGTACRRAPDEASNASAPRSPSSTTRAARAQRASIASGQLRGFDLLTLLHEAAVQRELGLTDDHRNQIDVLVDEYMTELNALLIAKRDAHQSGQDAKERRRSMTEIEANRLERMAHYGIRCAALLSDVQQQRLQQVVFQLREFDVFFEPDVIADMAYSNRQARQLNTIRDRVVRDAAQLRSRRNNGELDKDALGSAVREVGATAYREAVRLLNQAQRAAFDKSRGPRINFRAHELALTLVQRAKQ